MESAEELMTPELDPYSGSYIILLANIYKERVVEDHKIFSRTVRGMSSDKRVFFLCQSRIFFRRIWTPLPWVSEDEVPGFSEVCRRVNPKVFGMLCEGSVCEEGIMFVRLYSTDAVLHGFDITKLHTNSKYGIVHTMRCGDGGLMCIVSTSEDKNVTPVSITVLNPLTRQWRSLPALLKVLSSVQPSMVQLVMDRYSKQGDCCGSKGRAWGTLVASIYSSETGQRSSPNVCEDLIFGHAYNWELFNTSDDESDEEGNRFLLPIGRPGPCVYDCANSKPIELDDGSSPWKSGAGRECSVLVKDKAFVLLKDCVIGADLTTGDGWDWPRYYIYLNIKSKHVNHIGLNGEFAGLIGSFKASIKSVLYESTCM